MGDAVLLVTTLTMRVLAFGFGPLPLTGWLSAVGAVLVGVAWFEIYKALRTGQSKA